MPRWLRLKLIPFFRFLGKLQMPWVKKHISGFDYEVIRGFIRPGDIFLTRTLGFASNLVIPGVWKHLGIMGEYNNIIEAIGEGVCTKDLAEFVLTKDEILVVRPKFCTESIAREVSQVALDYVGCKYDYEFSLGNKAFYCAELAYVVYASVLGSAFGFKPRKRLGVLTVTPDDFANAKNWWEIVYDSRIKNG